MEKFNCSIIQKAVRQGTGQPLILNGKCLGYAAGADADENDEPCEACKKCMEGRGDN